MPKPRVRLNLPAPKPASNAPNGAAPSVDSASPTPKFEIPDGTPIHLRFGQSVRGITRSLVKVRIYSREGDLVRLVASDDVRVNGVIVIPKGAQGQATVTSVPLPGITNGGSYQKGAAIDLFIPKTGTVSLELDWIEDITGEKVPLRALASGESKPFVMSVWSEQEGMVVYPAKVKHDMKGLFQARLRPWAPTGARMTAFVDGATEMDPDEVKQSQELLPVPNENAILTLYRSKGQPGIRVSIVCDEKPVASLGQFQYVSFEVTPGKHRCQVAQQAPLDFEARGGDEQFLHVHHKSGELWEIVPVQNEEGEDGTAKGDLVQETTTPAVPTDADPSQIP